MTNSYVHLHLHTHGSPLDGCQTVKQIVEKAVSLGMPAVAVTDHGRCGELLNLKRECLKAGIKPIFGTEAYVAPTSHLTKERVDGHNKTSYHQTLLALNHEGLKNIFRLSSKGWIDGFYYRPRIDMQLLQEHSEGILCLSGCAAGRASIMILEDRVEDARQNLIDLRNIFKDNFYVELQNHNLPWQADLNKVLVALASDLSIPTVITQDSHYLNKEDSELHKYVTKIAAGDLEFATDQLWFKTREEMEEMFDKEHHHALDRTLEVADKCNCDWPTGRTIWPVYPLENNTPEEELKRLSYEGFDRLIKDQTQEYKDRIEYELGVINSMGFATYFLIVQDFINWAKKNNIATGPARGSIAGCFVAYCIGITEVDSIKYRLPFERFLNSSRVSLPDADLDFNAADREKVFEYVKEKYGADKVSNIGTSAVFKPRGSIRAFARVMDYEDIVAARLASLVPPNIAGKTATFEESIIAEPKLLAEETLPLIQMARRAEGIKNQFGVHAAGVVVSDKPITDYLPLFVGRNGKIAAQFDMGDVEEIGLVKFDFLGLKNLGVIQETIELIKKHHDVDIDICSLEDGDEKTYSTVFKTGNLDGVFQFETSSGFKDLCIKAEPKNIEDLSAITAIYRPGPLALKLHEKYVAVRCGADPDYLIPELEPILKETAGCLIYQEEIMEICKELAGYSLSSADNMRRIIGKKKEKEMKEERNKFVNGCIANRIKEENANQLFDFIEGFASYSFNKGHSVGYSFISYRTAWLKAHYPLEFYTALLNNAIESDQDSIVKYVWSAKENGISILPPDVSRSESKFSIDSGCIIFGLSGVKGIGDKAAEQVLAAREEKEFETIDDPVMSGVNQGTIKSLAACGALEGITELSRKQIIEYLPELVKYHEKLAKWTEQKQKFEENEQLRFEAVAKGEKPPRRRAALKDEPIRPEIVISSTETKEERLAYERATLGVYITGHPLDRFPYAYKLAKTTIADIMGEEISNGELVSVPAVISSITEKRTRSKQNMAILKIEDKSSRIEATIFPKKWAELKDFVQEDIPCIISGRVEKIEIETEDSEVRPATKIIINSISIIDERRAVKTNYDFSLIDGTKVEVICGEKADINKIVFLLKNLRGSNG
jgi:DNA polymerase-3 subunit alpha